MKNNQNVIIAIVLSFLVIVGWQFFIVEPEARGGAAAAGGRAGAARRTATPAPAPGRRRPRRRAGAPPPPSAGRAAPAPRRRDRAGGRAARRGARRSRSASRSTRRRSRARSTSPAGGIDDLLLADYHVTVEPTSPLVELFSPVGSEHPYFADFGWVAAAGGPAVPNAETVWTRRRRAARARQGRDAHLGQRRRARLQAHLSRSTRNTCSPSARAWRTRPARRSTLFPYGARQPHRAAADRRLLHPARGPDRLSSARRACRRSTTASSTTRPSITPAKVDARAGSASPTNTGARR